MGTYLRKYLWICLLVIKFPTLSNMEIGWCVNYTSPYMASDRLHASWAFGFIQSKADYSLFTKGQGEFVTLLVYVDDMVITSPNI